MKMELNKELLYKVVYAIFNKLVSKVSDTPLFPEEETASRLKEAFSITSYVYRENLPKANYREFIRDWRSGIDSFFGWREYRDGKVYIDPLVYAENIVTYNKLYSPKKESYSPTYFAPKRFGLEGEEGVDKKYIAAGVALCIPLIMSFMHTAPLKGERKFTIPHVDITLELYRESNEKEKYNIDLDGTGGAFFPAAKSPREAVLMLLMQDLMLAQVSSNDGSIWIGKGLENCAEFSALIYSDLEGIANDYSAINKDKVAFEYFLTEVVPMREVVRF